MRRWIQFLLQHTDVLIAVGVITILGVMIVPLPTYLLDFFLTVNISMALLVLMLTIYIAAPLELSVFPGLLLVLTLFRLSLNVASTRLILSEADAGRLIAAFGEGRYGQILRDAAEMAAANIPVLPVNGGPRLTRVGRSTPRKYWEKHWIQLYHLIHDWLDAEGKSAADERLAALDVEVIE